MPSLYRLADIPDLFKQFADVRNVAEAHYKSAVEGKNERYIVCNGSFTNQTIVDAIRKDFPELKERLAEGNPGEKVDGKVFKLDAGKSEKDLGIKCEFEVGPSLYVGRS